MEGVKSALMPEYLDSHMDVGFENYIDKHFEGTPFLTECLKIMYRYFLRDQSAILRKTLRLIIAYNLTLESTMMEDESQDDKTGYVPNSDSKLFGKMRHGPWSISRSKPVSPTSGAILRRKC